MKRLLPFLLLFLAVPASAAGQARAEARAVPPKTTIGGEIRLFVTLDHPKGWTARPPAAADIPAPLELKRVDVQPYVAGKNRVRETFVLTLTAFEIGRFTVPPLTVQYRDASGKEGAVRTEPVPVEIASVAPNPPKQAALRPIKGPVSLSGGLLRDVLLGTLAALLSVFLAVKVAVRRHRRPKPDPESLLPPHERARRELDRLVKKGLESESKWTELFDGYSGILRRYLERALGVEALERTTSEILAELRGREVRRDAFDRIRAVLETADLVKFAKFAPPRAASDKARNEILEVVELTQPEPQPEAAKR